MSALDLRTALRTYEEAGSLTERDEALCDLLDAVERICERHPLIASELPRVQPPNCPAGGPGCTSRIVETRGHNGPMGVRVIYRTCPQCGWVSEPFTARGAVS